MNILFVNATRSWGGIKSWMLRLGEYLQNRGHQVQFACLKGDELIGRCEDAGLVCQPMTFGPDYSPLAVMRFLKLIRKNRIDLVISNVSKDIRTAGIAARIAGIAHVNRLGLYGDIKDKFKVRLEYTRWVDKVLVPSLGLYEHLDRLDCLNGKLKVIRNCVKTFPLRINRNEKVRFAVVAVLSPRKQVDKIITAFARLPESLPWELHIGGFGSELERLKAASRRHSLDRRIFFHGRISDPYDFLKDKDAGILYSTSEGSPNSLLEYMTMSLVVIASRIEGVRDIIEDGIDGLLVDPSSTDDLSTSIRNLIENPELRYRLATSAHQKIQREYDIDSGYREIEIELQKAVNRKHVHQIRKPPTEMNYAKRQHDST